MFRVGRDREKHKRLPKGWAPSASGTVYFRPTNAEDREIVKGLTGGPLSLKLGETHDEAAQTYATLIVAARVKARRDEDYTPGTVGEICYHARQPDGFLEEIEHPKTRKERARHVDELEREFGKKRYARNVYEASRDTAGVYFRAMDAERHRLKFKGKRGFVSANRRVRSWELLFSWARAPLGLTEYNPCSGLQDLKEKARAIVPDDDGIYKLYRWLDPPARFMVAMIRFYGRRKAEQLGVQLSDVRDDGIHFRRAKDEAGRPIRVAWDPRLSKMVARVMRWREEVIRPTKKNKAGRKRKEKRVLSTALLLNQRGRAYTESGFNSARKRAMKRAGIYGAFTFHDLRKSAVKGRKVADAQNLLAHDDMRTTSRIYQPGEIVVDLNEEVAAKRRKA